MTEQTQLAEEHGVKGTPKRGLMLSTLVFFAGLTTIVFYGAAGPIFEEHLALSGILHGLLGSPHLSKAILRIPFGAWVDEVDGKKPLLLLMASTIIGTGGLVVTLFLTYPTDFDMSLYPLLVFFGFLAGAGGATFSAGITQTSYWYPSNKQGFALGAFAGIGNIGPGGSLRPPRPHRHLGANHGLYDLVRLPHRHHRHRCCVRCGLQFLQ